MYMSYCRHEGTLHELRACLGDAEEHINEEAEYNVSDNEIACFETMVREFYEFLTDNELLDEFGELNEEQLDRVCELMRTVGDAD